MKPQTRARSCLHLVVRSSPRAVASCLAQIAEGDAMLFLDDGVMHILNDRGRPFRPPFAACCFSAVDLEARGLSGLAQDAGAVMLTDSEIAGMVQTHDYCLTWK